MRQIYYCYYNGVHKALTMSYDDGREADKRLVGIFNKYGIKGSFHLNGGLFYRGERVTVEEIPELYKGHEISAHTSTHPTIGRCPIEYVAQEVLEDRRKLEEITGYPVRGMSYPNGSYTEEIKNLLPSLGIEYSRVVETSGGFDLPGDFYEWKATCHHNKGLMDHTMNFLNLHKKQYLYLMYVWGHSYEFDNDNNWDLIEEFCRKVSGQDDVWYATNIEIVDYLKALKNLKFSADFSFVYNPSFMDLWISVDGDIVMVPGGKQISL